MSTENNSELLFDNSVGILKDLIAFKTISGQDNSSLIDYCDEILKKLGATSFRTYDNEKKYIDYEYDLIDSEYYLDKLKLYKENEL